MSEINIDKRLRPIRFAFLVRPDDAKNTLEIFRVNTCLWGGKFNPIIPCFKKKPKWWDRDNVKFKTAKQIISGYLDFFEPDFLVEAEPGLAKDYGFDPNRVIQLSAVLANSDMGGFGLNVLDLYQDLYSKTYQFQRRHKDNIVYVTSTNKAIESFVACNFGTFPKQKELLDFERIYKKAFEPQIVELDRNSILSLYKDQPISPLEMNRQTINIYYNEYSNPTLFFMDVKQSRDLIDYWNLRTIYRNVIAIPIQWIQELLPFCRKFILNNYRPIPENPYGTMIRSILMFSRSLSDKVIEETKSYFRGDAAFSIQTWYPEIGWNLRGGLDRRPTLEASKNELMNISFEPKIPVIVNTLSPEFSKNVRASFYQYATVIRMQSFNNDQLATVFPCDYKKDSFLYPSDLFEHRVLTSEGLVFFSQYNRSSMLLSISDGTGAVNKWLDNQGIKATPSDAGRVTEQIIKTLGGFHGVRSLANTEVVKLFDKISRKPLKSMPSQEFKNNIDCAVKNKVPYNVFNSLVKNKAVELGSEIRCAKCNQWSWYSIKQTDYKLTCAFCLQESDFPIIDPNNSKLLRYAYRLVGPFSLPDYARGGYASALAIRFFGAVFKDGSTIAWSSGQELQIAADKKIEADFILWSQVKHITNDPATEIIFGEAKSFGKDAFTQDDIDRMKLLAQTFPGSYFVFATLKETFSKGEVGRIKQFVKWGKVYDNEHRQIRAHVIILTGVELFTDFFLLKTWEEKGKKYKELLCDPWIAMNRMNLKYLAEFTQKIYLEMAPHYE